MKRDVEPIRVPIAFKKAIDKKRIEEGFNNRERVKFLRHLCKKEDPLGHIFEEKKKKKRFERGGVDFGL